MKIANTSFSTHNRGQPKASKHTIGKRAMNSIKALRTNTSGKFDTLYLVIQILQSVKKGLIPSHCYMIIIHF